MIEKESTPVKRVPCTRPASQVSPQDLISAFMLRLTSFLWPQALPRLCWPLGALMQQPDGFCRLVCPAQVAATPVMQVLRLLLCRSIEARLGTDGKRRPGTIALGLGLAHPTPLTLK